MEFFTSRVRAGEWRRVNVDRGTPSTRQRNKTSREKNLFDPTSNRGGTDGPSTRRGRGSTGTIFLRGESNRVNPRISMRKYLERGGTIGLGLSGPVQSEGIDGGTCGRHMSPFKGISNIAWKKKSNHLSMILEIEESREASNDFTLGGMKGERGNSRLNDPRRS